MATMRDVAEAAQVSTATVSRVLNGTGPVSTEVRQRVHAAIDSLGYTPNALARSLRTESTGTIGLIVSSILNPFFTELARAAEDVAEGQGFNVIIGNADESRVKEERYLRALLEKRVDGLLLNPASADAPHIREAVDRDVPVVLIDRTVDGVDAPLVRADGRAAIRDLVNHLAEVGHRRLGMISGPRELRNGRDRYEAYTEAAAAIGLPVSPEHISYGDFERESGAKAMMRLLATHPRPDVVFVANGRMTLGALEAVRAANVRVPDDIGLASYDNDPWFALVEPPLTAIEQPTAEMGRLAMTALLGLIRRAGEVTVPPLTARLVVRASCGRPLTPHLTT